MTARRFTLGKEVIERQLRGGPLLVLVAVGGMSSYLMGAQRFLHIAQVEPNQTVSKEYSGDAAGAAKAMDCRFADL